MQLRTFILFGENNRIQYLSRIKHDVVTIHASDSWARGAC